MSCQHLYGSDWICIYCGDDRGSFDDGWLDDEDDE